MKQKEKNTRFPKPSAFLLSMAYLVVKPYYVLKYGLTIDRSGIKDLQGPALVLSPHISGKDHILHALTLIRFRPTFVVSEHFMSHPLLRFFLQKMHVITKKMFSADVSTIINILKAKASGNVIVLFPEGRLTWIGHSGKITAGTSDLVKKLGIPVYSVISNGAYLTFPKWGLTRRGKIHVETKKLISREEIAVLSSEEIEARITEGIHHNEENSMPGVRYRCKERAKGLDQVLYLCPECGALKSLMTQGHSIRCQSCGMSAELDEYYRLTGCRFSGINEWHRWQCSQIQTDRDSFDSAVLMDAVRHGEKMATEAGQGRFFYNQHRLLLEGTLFGQPYRYESDAEKVAAFPVTIGHHFDLYDSGLLLNIRPEDTRDVVRIADFCDALHSAEANKNTSPEK